MKESLKKLITNIAHYYFMYRKLLFLSNGKGCFPHY